MLNGLPEIERVRRRALKYLNRVHRLLESQPKLPGMAEQGTAMAIDALQRAANIRGTAGTVTKPIGRQRVHRPKNGGSARIAIASFLKPAIPEAGTQEKKGK